jgi:hypothetical protein
MNSETLIQWIRRQGDRVVTTASSHWHEIRPRVFQALPYHHLIAPSEAEFQQLLHRERALALRYSAALGASEGKISYHVVNSNRDYEVTQLSKKARYDVRRGLKYAGVEPIPFARLASDGWVLRQETLARQGRLDAETAAWWERLCRSAEGLPGFEAWGSLHDGKLLASILSLTIDDCCTILYQQSSAEALQNSANHALTYSVTRELLHRPGITQIFYGLHSLDAEEELDEFKFRLGYVARPVRQRVVVNRWMRRLLNGVSYGLLKRARSRWPQQCTLAKAEGMVRFYLEGRKPLTEQIWPECLKDSRAQLLGG